MFLESSGGYNHASFEIDSNSQQSESPIFLHAVNYIPQKLGYGILVHKTKTSTKNLI